MGKRPTTVKGREAAKVKPETPEPTPARRAGQPVAPSLAVPRPPARAAAVDAEMVAELDAAMVSSIDESTVESGAAYPLWPALPAGAIDRVAVFRKLPRAGDPSHYDWKPVALPWSAATLTWELVAEICGGGAFGIIARSRGKVVASAQRTLEGPPRAITQKDIYKLTPGLNQNGDVTETPNGWVAIPGVDGSTQAAFIAFQQTTWGAREDLAKMTAAMFGLLERLGEAAFKPDPGLSVLENIASVQRETIDRLYKELRDQRAENLKLQIESASSGKELSKMKIALYQKGVDVIDGIAGNVVLKLAEANEAANKGNGAANVAGNVARDIGASLAKKLLPQGSAAPSTGGTPAGNGAT